MRRYIWRNYGLTRAPDKCQVTSQMEPLYLFSMKCRPPKLSRTSQTEDIDDEDEEKSDLVEPVVFKDGPMTAAARNFVYSSHNLPGIGRKSMQSEEDKKKRKVPTF